MALVPRRTNDYFCRTVRRDQGNSFLDSSLSINFTRKPQLPFMDSWWWRLSKFFLRSQSYLLQNNFHWFRWSNLAFELYRLADVGVVPSLFEPFGYVPVEMMMHELPIVATATSGLNEVVDESCGLKVPLIVSPDSVEIDTSLLAQKIVYLLQNPKEAKRLGKNGRKRYLEKYSSEVFGKNMIAFYKSLFQECK